MKDANIQPDAYVFSQILYGYMKANCPAEVASTQEIMTRMGLWPSRIAYASLMSAHAELGEKISLVNTLNEALELLPNQAQPANFARSTPEPSFSHHFVIQLYVKLLNAMPEVDATCPELLAKLPVVPDGICRTRARGGVKQLLANGRMVGAQELFKRADPESADDPYLMSLVRYMQVGGLDPQSITSLWKIADVSGSRLSMLQRMTTSDVRRQSAYKQARANDALRESMPPRDPDAIIKAHQQRPNKSFVSVYNYTVPQLLRTGLTPEEVMERIETLATRSVSAFGCVLARLAPPSSNGKATAVDYDAVEEMVNEYNEKAYFPMEDFIQISPTNLRQLLYSATLVPEDASSETTPQQQVTRMLDLLSRSVGQNQLRVVASQLFEYSLTNLSRGSAGKMGDQSRDALHMLMHACISKDIKFPADSWIFYGLENNGFPQTEQDQLKLPLSMKNPRNARSHNVSMWQQLNLLIRSGNIDGAVELLQTADSRSSQTLPSAMESRFPDPVAIAFQITHELKKPDTTEISSDSLMAPAASTEFSLTGKDLERLLWTAWDKQLLRNPIRALNQVATLYLREHDLAGLADYFRRTSKHVGAMQYALLTPSFMKVLLEDNFVENLELFQSMIANSFLNLADFTSAACTLEDLLSNNWPNSEPAKGTWNRADETYWPIQIMTQRFEGMNHLQKLRTVHNAIDSLCKSTNLSAAHSLRLWAHQLGLLIFPRTNELLLLSPYFLLQRYRPRHLPPAWCASHELSQHFPVTLSSQQLTSLDALLLAQNEEGESINPIRVSQVVDWLLQNTSTSYGGGGFNPSPFSANAPPTTPMANAPGRLVETTQDNSTNHWVPTWLVVSQRLEQAGSNMIMPSAWYQLACDWLKRSHTAITDASGQYRDWFTYAPSVQHKSALLLAALANPDFSSQPWFMNRLKWDRTLFYTALINYTDLANASPEQESNIYQCLCQIGGERSYRLARLLSKDTLDADQLTELWAQWSSDKKMTSELAAFTAIKDSLLQPIVDYLQQNRPEEIPHFFNDLLFCLQTSSRRLNVMKACHDVMSSLSLNETQLNLENQAFLDAAYSLLDIPHPEGLISPWEALRQTIPAELADTWIVDAKARLARQDFSSLPHLVARLPTECRDTVWRLIVYALCEPGETSSMRKLVVAIAELADGTLLQYLTQITRPFLPPGLLNAFEALSRHYSNRKLDWFSRATIRYHGLGPLLQTRINNAPATAAPITSRRPFNAVNELAMILRQPISSVVGSIVEVQSDPVKLNQSIDCLGLSGWSAQRKIHLLSYLTAAGATEAVNHLLGLASTGFTGKQAPFGAFARIIRGPLNEEDQKSIGFGVREALERLARLNAKDVTGCLKGPHAELLFRSWPSDHLADLLQVVSDASTQERNSLSLQFAAIMINRGSRGLAEQVIQTTGPLPITFLSGSPRHILSNEEFESTLIYLRDTDPDHVDAFVDTCIRNAVSTTNPKQLNHLNTFLRTVAVEPHQFALDEICSVPTVNLVAEFLRRDIKLPNDIQDLLRSVMNNKQEANA